MTRLTQPNEAVMAVTEISNITFRLGVTPALGGCIAHATWRHPSGAEVDLMRRGDAAAAGARPSDLACFPMVPFANRIDGGRIPLPDGGMLTVPINRPAQDVAIHGFGRERPWTIAARNATHLKLAQEFSELGNPYAYRAEQTFTLSSDTIDCRISVVNTGTRALPFGLGFHPWFRRTAQTRLVLDGRWAFRMDDRSMPVEPVALPSVTGGRACAVAARAPFDTPVAEWDGCAEIHWPDRHTALRIEAQGACSLVHIFAPAQPDVLCVEPVSHMPDVVNRRHLARFGDMAWLPPLGTLAGGMLLRPAAV
jgi:aldose 1-epimerase